MQVLWNKLLQSLWPRGFSWSNDRFRCVSSLLSGIFLRERRCSNIHINKKDICTFDPATSCVLYSLSEYHIIAKTASKEYVASVFNASFKI